MTSMPSVNETAERQDPVPPPPPAEPPTAGAARKRRSLIQAGRRTPLPRHFAWRLVLLRFLVNAVALALTVVIVPQVYFVGDYRIVTWLVISAVFGLLNAFAKPIVQVVMLPFMFVSYGLVVILINGIMLWVLDVMFPERFQVGHILWLLLGGLVFSAVAGFLENMLGLSPPIFEGEPKALREEIERRTHGSVEAKILAVAHGAPTADAGAAAEAEAIPAEAVEAEAIPAEAVETAAAGPPEGTPPVPPEGTWPAEAWRTGSEEITLVFPAPLAGPEDVASRGEAGPAAGSGEPAAPPPSEGDGPASDARTEGER